jgi:hypothetical protein
MIHNYQKLTFQLIGESNPIQIQLSFVRISQNNMIVRGSHSPKPVIGPQNQANTHSQLGTKLALPQSQSIGFRIRGFPGPPRAA